MIYRSQAVRVEMASPMVLTCVRAVRTQLVPVIHQLQQVLESIPELDRTSAMIEMYIRRDDEDDVIMTEIFYYRPRTAEETQEMRDRKDRDEAASKAYRSNWYKKLKAEFG
jgi:hypothetical protein